jgi:hypothetical protein
LLIHTSILADEVTHVTKLELDVHGILDGLMLILNLEKITIWFTIGMMECMYGKISIKKIL